MVFTALDGRKEKLPLFLAANTSRIPSFKDIEFCTLLSSVRNTKDDLVTLMNNLNASVTNQIDKLTVELKSTALNQSNLVKAAHSSNSDTTTVMKLADSGPM